MKLKILRGQLLYPILSGKVFHIPCQDLYTVQVWGFDAFKMVNFVLQKNTFIFQGNQNNEDDDGKYYEPWEEQKIGNWLVLFRVAWSQILSATLSLALRERELFSISSFPGGIAFRVNTFSEGTVLQVHTG